MSPQASHQLALLAGLPAGLPAGVQGRARAAALLSSLALGTGMALPSQTILHSPTWLDRAEGGHYCDSLGRFPVLRYQMVDGENRGKTAGLSEIALRLDHRRHDAISAPGRSFAKLVIQLADGDLTSFSTTFSSNYSSTPTRVFSGSITWPTRIGYPPTRPDVWGGSTGEYRLPFSSSWQTSGQKDILSDWSFTGGRLLNGQTWSATTAHDYYFDSYGDPNTTVEGDYRSIPVTRLNNNSSGVTSRCNDSAFGSIQNGAFSRIYGYIYSKWAANIHYREKLVMYSTSYYTAPNTTVVHAWGLLNSLAGTDIGTGCNRLHLAGPLFHQFFQVPPKSVFPNGYSGFAPIAWKWTPIFANFRVTMQAGWTDSVTGQFRLTQAREVILPAAPPPPAAARRRAVYQYASLPVAGPLAQNFANPGLRYR